MPITIVSDSACDLSPEIAAEYGIRILPLHVMIGLESYLDRVDLTPQELYAKLRTTKEFSTTSQPSVQEFTELYQSIEGPIISIHLDASLSGTVNTARKAKEMLGSDGERISVVDSESISLGAAFQCMAASRWAAESRDVPGILAGLDELKHQVRMYFTLTDLSYLARGGRIGKAQAAVGNLLKLRPVLTFSDHVVSGAGRAFGTEQGITKVVELARQDHELNPIKRLFIVHAGGQEDFVRLLEEKTRAALGNDIEYLHGEVGAAVSTHVGPNSYGLMYHS